MAMIEKGLATRLKDQCSKDFVLIKLAESKSHSMSVVFFLASTIHP